MQVYVIASSNAGPSKIGYAIDPRKRLRALQTGNHRALSLYHSEPIGPSARSVEHAVHNLLREKRSSAGNEWFDIATDEAITLIRDTAKNLGVLFADDSCILRDASTAAVLKWLEQKNEFEESIDYMEEYGIKPPDLLELLATTLKIPAKTRSTFNDYILTWDDGMWIRWAFERMGRRLPASKMLTPYLAADDFLEARNSAYRRRIGTRWIEWSMGRDLQKKEGRALADIWNKYVTSFNRVIAGGGHDAHGTSDHVDDVYVYALIGDSDRGDQEKIVFAHKDFRAVLIPVISMKLVRNDKFRYRRPHPLGTVGVRGFITPRTPNDIWERSVHAWRTSAEQNQETSFARFLNNPAKKYPRIQRHDFPCTPSQAWQTLSCIDELGGF